MLLRSEVKVIYETNESAKIVAKILLQFLEDKEGSVKIMWNGIDNICHKLMTSTQY